MIGCEVRFLRKPGSPDKPACPRAASTMVRVADGDEIRAGFACHSHTLITYLHHPDGTEHTPLLTTMGKPCECPDGMTPVCEWQLRANGERVSMCLRCGGDR